MALIYYLTLIQFEFGAIQFAVPTTAGTGSEMARGAIT